MHYTSTRKFKSLICSPKVVLLHHNGKHCAIWLKYDKLRRKCPSRNLFLSKNFNLKPRTRNRNQRRSNTLLPRRRRNLPCNRCGTHPCILKLFLARHLCIPTSQLTSLCFVSVNHTWIMWPFQIKWTERSFAGPHQLLAHFAVQL